MLDLSAITLSDIPLEQITKVNDLEAFIDSRNLAHIPVGAWLLIIRDGAAEAFELPAHSQEADRIRLIRKTCFAMHDGFARESRILACLPQNFVKGYVDRINHRSIEGWAVNLLSPEPIEVALFVNGLIWTVKTCDMKRSDLAELGISSSFHGFSFPIEQFLSCPFDEFEVRTMLFGVPIPEVANENGDWTSRELSRTKRHGYSGLNLELKYATRIAPFGSDNTFNPVLDSIGIRFSGRVPLDSIFGAPENWSVRGVQTLGISCEKNLNLRHLRQIESFMSRYRVIFPDSIISLDCNLQPSKPDTPLEYQLQVKCGSHRLTIVGDESEGSLQSKSGRQPPFCPAGLSAALALSTPPANGGRAPVTHQASLTGFLGALEQTLFVAVGGDEAPATVENERLDTALGRRKAILLRRNNIVALSLNGKILRAIMTTNEAVAHEAAKSILSDLLYSILVSRDGSKYYSRLVLMFTDEETRGSYSVGHLWRDVHSQCYIVEDDLLTHKHLVEFWAAGDTYPEVQTYISGYIAAWQALHAIQLYTKQSGRRSNERNMRRTSKTASAAAVGRNVCATAARPD